VYLREIREENHEIITCKKKALEINPEPFGFPKIKGTKQLYLI